MGAVVPIFVLNTLTAPLGAPLAYLVAALIPVQIPAESRYPSA